jgi:hypothetical protein
LTVVGNPSGNQCYARGPTVVSQTNGDFPASPTCRSPGPEAGSTVDAFIDVETDDAPSDADAAGDADSE